MTHPATSPLSADKNASQGLPKYKYNPPSAPCSTCSRKTFMVKRDNIPTHAREIWNGERYIRFCGPECEAKHGG